MSKIGVAFVLVASSLVLPAMSMDYYVDPVKGSMANPGTAAAPWSTFAAVIAAGKKFKPGDHVILRRGYHGNPLVTGVNAGDVYVHAQAGHTPTLRALRLMNAEHWNFKGLTVSPMVVPPGHADALAGNAGIDID